MFFLDILVKSRFVARRWEDKFDAKKIWSEAVVVRCQQPPRFRKVPLFFNAWLLMKESSRTAETGNCFMSSQLLQDRLVFPLSDGSRCWSAWQGYEDGGALAVGASVRGTSGC